MSNEEIIEFAICASSLKHSILGDVNIIDEQTIISLMKNGLQNIKR
jgi:2-dehydro-3-deoxygluconokinase